MNKNTSQLEHLFQKYMSDINRWLPEGILEVDLALLHRLELLKLNPQDYNDFSLTRYFQVLESPEKITLLNDQFIIWIVPEKFENTSITYTLIALNHPDGPRLEMAFSTWGIYNSSKLVLRVLEKFLHDIQETEELLLRFK